MPRRPKQQRQTYGEGSVYQRKSDAMWVATIEAGVNASQKRRRITVYGKDEETARRKLRDKKRALDRAGVTEVSARATVSSWSKEWLPIVERKLAPNAFNATRSAVNRWIVPTIGHVRFDALQPAHVRAVANAQRDAGRSSSTQLRTHSVLTSLLKAALIEGYPVTDRVLAVDAPTAAVSDRRAMSVEEALAVLEQAALRPEASRWVAALLQGMRQGEVLGLTWDEVDLDAGELRISWQLQPLPYRVARDRTSGFRVPDGHEAHQLKGRLHLVRPKSRSGWRVNPLVPWMHAALESWQAIAPESPHGLVWPSADGQPVPSKDDDAAWYALQDAAGVRHPTRLDKQGDPAHYTIHECRHTTATLLIEGGVDRATAAAIIGQSKLVESYVHLGRSPVVRQALEGVAARLQLSPALSPAPSPEGAP